jgi:hypothetical protein
MEKKGLCTTCVNDAVCNFPRKFPVLECEEFESVPPQPQKLRKAKRKKIKFK